MKKLFILFLLITLLKSLLLYLLILTGDIIPSVHILIRYLLYFLVVGFIDWKSLAFISKSMVNPNWIKFTCYTYATSFLVLWITGPIFQFHNYILNIQVEVDNGSPPIVGMIAFWVITLMISIVLSTNRIKNKKRSTANNGEHP